jgi:uncharacterized protein (DUF362 family)
MTRRGFLGAGLVFSVGAPLLLRGAAAPAQQTNSLKEPKLPSGPPPTSNARVALVRCNGYGTELRAAFDRIFDLLGGISPLVRNKTVTVKLNLTGTRFQEVDGRPAGETYLTHPATAAALASALFSAGASRVRFVESTNSRAPLESTLALGDWDVRSLSALGKVEFENTRNLGSGKAYSHLPVPGGGYMFTAFDVNHSYADTDVLVSLAKMKQHATAGVTLSLKNMFGTTPNALYGSDAGNEEATGGRQLLHSPRWGASSARLPGIKPGITSRDQTWRVPRIVADLAAACPIHLAIIDGISSVSGGEGPWCWGGLKAVSPGVLIAGFNGVSTDAVATAVMGYPDPRAERGSAPFGFCDNHILLAEKTGVGTADLQKIDVLGVSIREARFPFS